MTIKAVFPAYAGMSPSTSRRWSPIRGFPRLRGDEPALGLTRAELGAFSPPTRG